MAADTKYDVIIIGAGMGGLSAGAFLAREGKTVLILEKQNKPGGYVTSFTRRGYTFDSAIFHLTDMGEGQTISQFIRFWGGEVSSRKIRYKFRYFIGDKEYLIDGRNVEKDLVSYFPEESSAIRKFLSLSGRMMDEAMAQGPPKPPYEMNFFEKISFGITSLFRKRVFLKYYSRQSVEVLKSLFRDKTLASIIWGYYPIHSLVFLAHAFGWEMVKRDENYYPEGGMQAIPHATVRALEKNGGKLLLNSEVERILIKDRRAIGVKCADASEHYSDIVISNASIHHTLSKLLEREHGLQGLRAEVEKREVFVSGMFVFLGIDEKYDFSGVNFYIFLEEDTIDIEEQHLTPQNCPIMLIVPPKPKGQKNCSVLLPAILPYEHENYWRTGNTKVRGKQYRQLKEDVKNKIIERVCAKLGEEFRKAIRYSLAATPLTFERYTYNERGSFMGWKVDKAHYGKFIPQTTPIENLYLVGHWVFPGFGVPGVMASGYYLTKNILEKDKIDLEGRMKSYLENN
ncbi:4,4'-diapolycopene oxygenase [subsurface metagenome]